MLEIASWTILSPWIIHPSMDLPFSLSCSTNERLRYLSVLERSRWIKTSFNQILEPDDDLNFPAERSILSFTSLFSTWKSSGLWLTAWFFQVPCHMNWTILISPRLSAPKSLCSLVLSWCSLSWPNDDFSSVILYRINLFFLTSISFSSRFSWSQLFLTRSAFAEA